MFFTISIPFDIVSSPWIPSDNIKYNLIKFNLTKLCSYNLEENHISQIPIINIINQKETIPELIQMHAKFGIRFKLVEPRAPKNLRFWVTISENYPKLQ